jgi:hypothetical protein
VRAWQQTSATGGPAQQRIRVAERPAVVMASLAQVAGQYVFLLFGADGIGSDPSSTWVQLVGLAWMVVMTYHPAWSWFNPLNIKGDNHPEHAVDGGLPVHTGDLPRGASPRPVLIAFYYGATGFACIWYHRAQLTRSASDFLLKGLIALLGGLLLRTGLVLWVMHFSPHWQHSGVPAVLQRSDVEPEHPVYVVESEPLLPGAPATGTPLLPDSRENLVLPPPETTRD